MNDVPAVVAWVVALGVALVVAPALFRLRTSTPAVPQWRGLGLGWLAAATVLGPFVVSGSFALLYVLREWRAVMGSPAEHLGRALGGTIFLGAMYAAISVLFFALPYLPMLLLWGRLGPWLGWLERTRTGVAVSAVVLALPGALAAVLAYGVLDEPHGYKGGALLTFGVFILVAIAGSLFVPRVIFPALRAGRFAPLAGSLPPGCAPHPGVMRWTAAG